jgi:hypothetical protein
MRFVGCDRPPRRRAAATVLAAVFLAWVSGSVLPIVVCDRGEGRITVELALEPCCPQPAPLGEGTVLTHPHDCEGCVDRPLSSLGIWNRPTTDLPDAPTGAAIVAFPPDAEAPAVARPSRLGPLSAGPPDERAHILLPLLC